MCLLFSSGQSEAEARSRRSLASVNGEQGQHYEDKDKLQHPPNITPVGGVPNLKVISQQQYQRLKLHNKFHPEPHELYLKCFVIMDSRLTAWHIPINWLPLLNIDYPHWIPFFKISMIASLSKKLPVCMRVTACLLSEMIFYLYLSMSSKKQIFLIRNESPRPV